LHSATLQPILFQNRRKTLAPPCKCATGCQSLPISVVESTWRSGRVVECDGLENKLGGTTFLIFSITYATFSYLSWASKGQNLKANVQQIVQRFGMCATGPTRLLAPPRKGCFRGASTRPLASGHIAQTFRALPGVGLDKAAKGKRQIVGTDAHPAQRLEHQTHKLWHRHLNKRHR